MSWRSWKFSKQLFFKKLLFELEFFQILESAVIKKRLKDASHLKFASYAKIQKKNIENRGIIRKTEKK